MNINTSSVWMLYVDGASRSNPGLAGAGVVLLKNTVPVQRYGYFLGIKTNNQAEYLALLLGVFHVRVYALPGEKLTIFSDSQLMVKQMQGIYKVNNSSLSYLYILAHRFLMPFMWTIEYIPRHQNAHADSLANKGIDQKIVVPAEFLAIWQVYDER